jgi:ligand-binding sensor domain-containing protein
MRTTGRRTRFARLSLLLSAVIVSPATLGAQTISPAKVFGHYQQLYWQEQNGLPQNTVLDLATTRDGYLWIATGQRSRSRVPTRMRAS